MSLTAIFYFCLFFYLVIRALFGKPIYGLYAYIISIYMYAPGSWWGGDLPDLRWSFLSAIITLLAAFIHEINLKKNLPETAQLNTSWLSSPAVLLYIFFAIWVVLQNFWAMGDRHFEFSILILKFTMLIFLVHKTVRTIEDFVSVIVVHLLGCAFFGYLGLHHESGRFESAPTPGMSDGNLLSIHMVPFFVVSSYLLLLNVGFKKYYLVPFLVLALNAVFLTQSRGGLASLFIAGCFAIFFIPRYQRKTFYTLAFLGLLGGAYIIGDAFIERLSSTEEAETGEYEKSASSRLAIISSQFEMFSQSPVLGHGHSATLYLSPMFIDKKWLTVQGYRASHNLTMSLLVDHGVIGLLFYFGAIFWLILKLLKYRKSIVNEEQPIYVLLTGCSLGLIACLFGSQFSNSMRLEVMVWMIALTSLLVRWLAAGKNMNWSTKPIVKKNLQTKASL